MSLLVPNAAAVMAVHAGIMAFIDVHLHVPCVHVNILHVTLLVLGLGLVRCLGMGADPDLDLWLLQCGPCSASCGNAGGVEIWQIICSETE